MFFTKCTLFAEKNNFIRKKKFILIFFSGKAFFTENKTTYISFEKYFFIQKIYIHSAKKKMFLIIKNIFVKSSW